MHALLNILVFKTNIICNKDNISMKLNVKLFQKIFYFSILNNKDFCKRIGPLYQNFKYIIKGSSISAI